MVVRHDGPKIFGDDLRRRDMDGVQAGQGRSWCNRRRTVEQGLVEPHPSIMLTRNRGKARLIQAAHGPLQRK